jgi:hypothetical protein
VNKLTTSKSIVACDDVSVFPIMQLLVSVTKQHISYLTASKGPS